MIRLRQSHWLVKIVSLPLAMTMAMSVLIPGVDSVSARKRSNADFVQNFAFPGPIPVDNSGQTAPLRIFVSGFETEIADVNVTLHGLNTSEAHNVDVLLVGPGGQTALILSDAGTIADNATLTLDDQAATQVPSNAPLVSGAFKPTNVQAGDTFSPPAPTSPSSSSELSVFNSTDPNGTWTLFVRDDDFGASVLLRDGWSLLITSANGVPDAAPDTYSAQAGKTLIGDPSVLANDNDPDIDPLTAILADRPKKGTLQLAPDGTFTYRAKKKAKGIDRFTYRAQDSSGLSDLETATIKIKGKKNKKGKK